MAPHRRDAESGALWAKITQDADLRAIVTAWPFLPECVQTGILAMVKAAAEDDGNGRA